MSLGFGVPAALLGVVGQGSSVVALCGQDGQVRGGRVEAWAVLADVGVAAGLLRGCAQAVAAGEGGFDGGGSAPVLAVGVVVGGLAGEVVGQDADLLFGQVEGSFVFGTDGGVEQAA